MKIIKKMMESTLLEGTRYDQKASKVISSSGLYDEATSDAIIKALFEEDIHAFVHAPNWLEKYLVGIARMLVEEANGDKGRAEAFLNGCGPVFDEYLTWIKKNRTEENKQKLDDEFVNKMHYQDVKDFLDKIQSELDAQSRDEISKMKFSVSNYTLVPIESFEDFNSKYGGRATGDGSSDKYAGGGGTAWCHTNSEGTYKSWTSDGQKFFVLQSNNWKDIPFDKESNAQDPKDAYGTSLIAIRVDKYGRLKNATLRCNHVGVYSNADNQYETYAELSKVAGFNVEEKVKELIGNIPEYNPLKIKDGVLVKCDGDATNVIIPNSVTSIGISAFYGCSSLTSIEIPNSVTSIGNYAFQECNFTNIEIPNSVTSIGGKAFDSCESLTSIIIPNSVTSIECDTFADCTNLTSIEIPNSVTNIGIEAFYGCESLTSIEIPNSVTSVGERAFKFCTSLTSIEIPNSVTRIGRSAFSDCTSLTSIEIPNSVTSIGEYAFYECNRLTVITDNEYVINYCKENNIKYETITKKESLSITEALERLKNIKE